MKRKILLLIILSCIAAVSFGQRRSRSVVQKIITLTKPQTTGKMYFEEALSKLKNIYRFSGQTIDRSAIGQLAWAGLGNRVTPEMMASAGVPQPLQSPFPTQLFFTTNEGVFFYQPLNNSLEQIMEGDVRAALAGTTAMPESVRSAGCVIIITSSVTRNTGTRSGTATGAPALPASSRGSVMSRNAMLLEAGHIAQNIQLQAVCLGQDLGSITIGDFDSRAAAKVCGLPRELDMLNMVCVGYMTEQDREGSPGSNVLASSKKVAIIVPGENFQDVEFYTTLNTLDAAQIQIVVASNRLGPVRGVNMNSAPFDVQVLASQIRVADFDGIIIIGGPGAAAFINDQVVLNIIREAFDNRKIIGATSMGTAVLASSGILAEAVNISQMGGIFTSELVENDSRVITCMGPQGAVKFALAFTDAILGR